MTNSTQYIGKSFQPKINNKETFTLVFRATSKVKYNKNTDSHFVSGFELTYSDKTGKLLFEFKTNKATHIIDSDYIERN